MKKVNLEININSINSLHEEKEKYLTQSTKMKNVCLSNKCFNYALQRKMTTQIKKSEILFI